MTAQPGTLQGSIKENCCTKNLCEYDLRLKELKLHDVIQTEINQKHRPRLWNDKVCFGCIARLCLLSKKCVLTLPSFSLIDEISPVILLSL